MLFQTSHWGSTFIVGTVSQDCEDMARAWPRLVCACRVSVSPIGRPANAVGTANWDNTLRLDVAVFI
jgi:hypothetical protein